MVYFYVAIGGALGAMARFLVQSTFLNWFPAFPYGTSLVNLGGCFIAGLFMPYLASLPEAIRPMIIVGGLGALTTFSSFALEVVTLFEEKRFFAMTLHWGVNAFLCIMFCMIGFWIASRWN